MDFSKSDDEWGRGVKNLKKLMTSFMNGPIGQITIITITIIFDSYTFDFWTQPIKKSNLILCHNIKSYLMLAKGPILMRWNCIAILCSRYINNWILQSSHILFLHESFFSISENDSELSWYQTKGHFILCTQIQYSNISKNVSFNTSQNS